MRAVIPIQPERPSGSLGQNEIAYVDRSIGMMVSELKKKNLLHSTLIIITAKHGQSPVDSSRYQANGSPNDPATILGSCLPDSELNQIGPTEDDVALLWLKRTCDIATEVKALETASPALPLADNIAGIGEIFSGPGVNLYYNVPEIHARRTSLLLPISALLIRTVRSSRRSTAASRMTTPTSFCWCRTRLFQPVRSPLRCRPNRSLRRS